MSDKPNEGGKLPDEGGTPSQTLPEGSDKHLAGAPSQPQSLDEIKKELAGLKKAYEAVIQPEKDKGYRRLSDRLDQLSSTVIDDVIKLREKGLEPEEIKDKLFLKALREEREGKSPSEQPPAQEAGRAVSEAQFPVDDQLKELGLAADDPAVIAILRDFRGTRVVTELAKHAVRQAQKPAPSAAAAPAMQGGTSGGKPSEQELLAEYKKSMLAARGKPMLLASIRNEYAKKGVNVHNVDFTQKE